MCWDWEIDSQPSVHVIFGILFFEGWKTWNQPYIALIFVTTLLPESVLTLFRKILGTKGGAILHLYLGAYIY